MDEVTRLFSKVFFSLTNSWSDARSLRRVVNLGAPEATRVLMAEKVQWVTQFVEDPSNEDVFFEKDAFLKKHGGANGMAKAMTQTEIDGVTASVDAAAIVFMHSALDSAVHDLCRVTAMVAPDVWRLSVGDRKEQLASVRETGYEKLADTRVRLLLDSLSHESLLEKCERLFQVCKPKNEFGRKGYAFDKDRLTSLDQLRHDIVHGDRRRGPIESVDSAVDYLSETGLYFFGMVNHVFGVKVSPDYIP